MPNIPVVITGLPSQALLRRDDHVIVNVGDLPPAPFEPGAFTALDEGELLELPEKVAGPQSWIAPARLTPAPIGSQARWRSFRGEDVYGTIAEHMPRSAGPSSSVICKVESERSTVLLSDLQVGHV